MSYTKLPIGTANPGLIVILIDQSGSMVSPYVSGQTRAEFAALAVNRCIYNILLACSAGDKIKDRCHIGVIGYGQETKLQVAGRASEIQGQMKREDRMQKKVPDGAGGLVEVEHRQPIWIEAAGDNGTPMEEAFDLAGDLIQAWTRDNPDNFPPIVINITDGAPNDEPMARAAAQRVMSYGTSDGTVLIFNAHIGDPGQAELRLPPSNSGLSDPYSQFLFDISSAIPDSLAAAAELAFEKKILPGSRGFVMNAGAETLTKLLVFGSTPMTATRRE